MPRTVSSRFGAFLSLFLLSLAAGPWASAQATYYTNSDNENNASDT